MNRFFVFVILVLAPIPVISIRNFYFLSGKFVTVQSNNIALVYFSIGARTGAIHPARLYREAILLLHSR